MRRKNLLTTSMVAFFCFIMVQVLSQNVVNIWPDTAPGSENWKQKEQTIKNTPVGTVILNVVNPTPAAYFPKKHSR